jgi:hypothetical protein
VGFLACASFKAMHTNYHASGKIGLFNTANSKPTIMTDQELKDLVASLASAQISLSTEIKTLTAKTQASLDRLSEETQSLAAEGKSMMQAIKRQDKQIGGLSRGQGEISEAFFFNSLKNKPVIGHLKFQQVQRNVYFEKINQEYDLILVNGNAVALVEVKYRVHPEHLDQLKRQIELYKSQAPEYKNYTIYAGIAGLAIDPDLIDKAQEEGYFVLEQKGQTLCSYTEQLKAH